MCSSHFPAVSDFVFKSWSGGLREVCVEHKNEVLFETQCLEICDSGYNTKL